MRIGVVFGAGGIGDVGRHVISLASHDERISQVIAIGFEPQQLSDDVASVTQLDINMDKVLVAPQGDLTALTQVDAVVSTVGNRQISMARWMAPATRNMLNVLDNNTRFIAVTSVGINEDWPPLRWSWAAGTAFAWLLRTVLRSAYADIAAAEEAIRGSQMDYLIVRPAGLSPGRAPQGEYILLPAQHADGHCCDGAVEIAVEVAKEDVALFVLEQVLNPSLTRTATSITTAVKPQSIHQKN